MKKIAFAAIAALTLSLGVGSAFAAQTMPQDSRPQVVHNGADFATGGSGGN